MAQVIIKGEPVVVGRWRLYASQNDSPDDPTVPYGVAALNALQPGARRLPAEAFATEAEAQTALPYYHLALLWELERDGGLAEGELRPADLAAQLQAQPQPDKIAALPAALAALAAETGKLWDQASRAIADAFTFVRIADWLEAHLAACEEDVRSGKLGWRDGGDGPGARTPENLAVRRQRRRPVVAAESGQQQQQQDGTPEHISHGTAPAVSSGPEAAAAAGAAAPQSPAGAAPAGGAYQTPHRRRLRSGGDAEGEPRYEPREAVRRRLVAADEEAGPSNRPYLGIDAQAAREGARMARSHPAP